MDGSKSRPQIRRVVEMLAPSPPASSQRALDVRWWLALTLGQLGLALLSSHYGLARDAGVDRLYGAQGLSLAFLILCGYRQWPAVAFAGLLGEWMVADALDPAIPVLAATDTLQAIAGTWLFHHFRLKPDLGRVVDVAGLLGISAFLLQPVVAAVGASLVAPTGGEPWVRAWLAWGLAGAVGQMLVAAPVLCLGEAARAGILTKRWVRENLLPSAGLTLLGMLVVVGLFLSGMFHPLLAMPASFPLLCWIGVRYGAAGATLGTLLIAFVTFEMTSRGHGPFAEATGAQRMADLSGFFGYVWVMALPLATFFGERKRALTALQYRHDFEHVLSTLSRRFVSLTPDAIDASLNETLSELGRFTGADRCYLFTFSADHGTFRNTHKWCRENVAAGMPPMKGHPVHAFGWIMPKLLSGETVRVHCLDDLPPQAVAERQLFARLGIRSLINVPLMLRGKTIGFAGFDAVHQVRRWSDDDGLLLGAAADLFVHALERQRADQALAETLERMRMLADNVREVLWLSNPDFTRILYVNPAYDAVFRRPREALQDNPLDWMMAVHPEDLPQLHKALALQAAGQPAAIELRLLHPDGGIRWFAARSVPIVDREGSPLAVGFGEDITERREAETRRMQDAMRQQEVLVREVRHRIKNHLQGLAGLLRQHARRHPELAATMEAAIARVRVIGVTYGLQSQTSGGDVHLCEIVAAMAQGSERPARLPVWLKALDEHVKSALIGEAYVVPLALVINELIVNADKHGVDGASALIDIRLSSDDDRAWVRIGNPGALPGAFDFARGIGLGNGLNLAKALLPHEGTALTIGASAGHVQSVLTLTPPVIRFRAHAGDRPKPEVYDLKLPAATL
jgi:PAS domain S-box-containing protein